MIIYPARNSSSLLVGALFFDRPFPAFLGSSPSVNPFGLAIPVVPSMHPQTHYGQGMISNPCYDSPGHPISPHCSNPDSPADTNLPHAIARQVPYHQYMMPYGQGNLDSSPASVSNVNWTTEMHYSGGGGSSTQHDPTGQYR